MWQARAWQILLAMSYVGCHFQVNARGHEMRVAICVSMTWRMTAACAYQDALAEVVVMRRSARGAGTNLL